MVLPAQRDRSEHARQRKQLVLYASPHRLTEAELDHLIATVNARLAIERDPLAREKDEQDRRRLLEQLAIRIVQSRGWQAEQLSYKNVELEAWLDWIPDGTLDYESRSAWMKAIPRLSTPVLEGIAVQVRYRRDHPDKFSADSPEGDTAQHAKVRKTRATAPKPPGAHPKLDDPAFDAVIGEIAALQGTKSAEDKRITYPQARDIVLDRRAFENPLPPSIADYLAKLTEPTIGEWVRKWRAKHDRRGR